MIFLKSITSVTLLRFSILFMLIAPDCGHAVSDKFKESVSVLSTYELSIHSTELKKRIAYLESPQKIESDHLKGKAPSTNHLLVREELSKANKRLFSFEKSFEGSTDFEALSNRCIKYFHVLSETANTILSKSDLILKHNQKNLGHQYANNAFIALNGRPKAVSENVIRSTIDFLFYLRALKSFSYYFLNDAEGGEVSILGVEYKPCFCKNRSLLKSSYNSFLQSIDKLEVMLIGKTSLGDYGVLSKRIKPFADRAARNARKTGYYSSGLLGLAVAGGGLLSSSAVMNSTPYFGVSIINALNFSISTYSILAQSALIEEVATKPIYVPSKYHVMPPVEDLYPLIEELESLDKENSFMMEKAIRQYEISQHHNLVQSRPSKLAAQWFDKELLRYNGSLESMLIDYKAKSIILNKELSLREGSCSAH